MDLNSIVAFNPQRHLEAWTNFIRESYRNPAYVLLSEHFRRWQFYDNPANGTGAHTLWLVLHRDAVVAQLGFVPFIGQEPDGGTFRGAYPVNLIVDPGYRALGLGAILMDRLLRQTIHVVNPGSSEAGTALCAGLGMTDLGHLHRWIAIVDPGQAVHLAADGKLPGRIKLAAAENARIGAGLAPLRRLPDSTPDSFQLPVAAWHASRNRNFMRWRYENHPGFDYEFLLDESGQNILVFHEEREAASGALLLRIVDLVAADEQAALRLLGAAVLAAHARGAVLIDFYCSLAHYAPALEKMGFFNERDHDDGRIAALFQPLDFRKAGIRVLVSGSQDNSSWYITKADSDQDRPTDAGAVEQRVQTR